MKSNSLLHLGKLFLGCVFLFTPNVSLFDLLPDFIGFALLLSAIKEATFVFPHFDEAYRGFKRMLYISIAKLPAAFLMLSIASKSMDERSIVTVFSLSFAVLDLVFLLPAFRAFWEGFSYIGQREGISVCLTDGGEKSVDSLTVFTLVFLTVKHAMSTLPEMSLLSLFEKMGSLDPGAVNLAALYPAFAVLGAIIVLVLGIMWLARIRRFLYALRADEQMTALLSAKAEEQKETIRTRTERRRALSLLYLLMGAFLFTVDPIFDDRDVLPNLFAAILLFLVFCYADGARQARAGRWISAVYGTAALATFVMREIYFADFTPIDVAFRDEALLRYTLVEALTVLESLLLIAVILLLCAVLRDFIKAKTGKGLRETDLVLRNNVHAALLLRLKRFGVLGVIYAICRAAEVFLLAAVERHVITEDEANQYYGVGDVVYSSRFGGSWFLLLCIGIALAVYLFFLLRAIRDEMGAEKD